MNYKTLCDKLVEGIKLETKGRGVVVGISGGIDSAVAAALSVLALGKDQVKGITMPYHNQNTIDADEIAKTLGISYDRVEIGPIVDVFEQYAPQYFAIRTKEDSAMPKSNLQSRVRMCLLYGAANKMRRLVVGTTNRSEYLIGYFTKYGDGGVDFEPIGDIYKTEVWGLAKYLKENHFPDFPQQIIDKKPSAELEHGMTDEEELEFSYLEFDQFIQKGEKDIDPEKVKKMKKWLGRSEHKRRMPPVTRVRT